MSDQRVAGKFPLPPRLISSCMFATLRDKRNECKTCSSDMTRRLPVVGCQKNARRLKKRVIRKILHDVPLRQKGRLRQCLDFFLPASVALRQQISLNLAPCRARTSAGFVTFCAGWAGGRRR